MGLTSDAARTRGVKTPRPPPNVVKHEKTTLTPAPPNAAPINGNGARVHPLRYSVER